MKKTFTEIQNGIYETVTQAVLAQIEKGVNPWQKPWAAAAHQRPQNFVNGTKYSGVNFFLLNMMGFEYNLFATWNQISQYSEKHTGDANAWHVQKGEKSIPVVYWNFIYQTEDGLAVTKEGGQFRVKATGQVLAKDQVVVVPFLKMFRVFNIMQTNIPAEHYVKDQPVGSVTEEQQVEVAEQVISNMSKRPTIQFAGSEAYYSPIKDLVNMPEKTRFHSINEFYATQFHELAHSTGHPSRLNRIKEMGKRFGDEKYSKEELVAEMSSNYILAFCQIDAPIQNSAAYLKHWWEKLNSDPKLFVQAAGKAKQVAQYILGDNLNQVWG